MPTGTPEERRGPHDDAALPVATSPERQALGPGGQVAALQCAGLDVYEPSVQVAEAGTAAEDARRDPFELPVPGRHAAGQRLDGARALTAVSFDALSWGARHVGFLALEFVLLAGLAALSVAVLEVGRGPLPGDVALTLWWQHLILPQQQLAAAVESVSAVNAALPVAIVAVLVTAILLLLRRRLEALVLLGTLAAADGANFLLKALIQRPRPSGFGIVVHAHITTTFSFPSGHVVHAVAYLGMLVFLSFQVRRPLAAWPARLLWITRALLLTTILLMLPSRVLEGEHWPSDGLAAWFEGLFWLLLAIRVYYWMVQRWPRLTGIREPRPGPRPEAPASQAPGG